MPLHRLAVRAEARAIACLGALLLLPLVPGCDAARRAPDAAPVAACTRCHGGERSADGAPPRDLAGRSDGPAVGAHQAHLGRGVTCGECHLVPARTTAPEHQAAPLGAGVTTARARVTLGGRAALGGLAPAYDYATATCTVYCHGATLGADGPPAPPRWGQAGPLGCGGCHGAPPPSAPHGPALGLGTCATCHPETVDGFGALLAGGRHLDGRIDAARRGCDACHGAPPATGAHRRHATRAPDQVAYGDTRVLEEIDPVNAAGQADYAFGCGQCHPLDPARHLDGTLQVELSPGGAPQGSLRARNAPDAAWDRATGRCAGVACHSSGQAAPAFTTSPPWAGGPDPAGCAGCHGNPPMYPNGGAGSATANGHLGLSQPAIGVYSASWGHVRSSHSMPHGGEYDGFGWGRPPHGSPRTCQTCHYDTVDPANTAPGGFYYLDTTVRTLVSISPSRPADVLQECQTCHTGQPGAPPVGRGRALPLRHVNGRRDVAFDRRTAVPPGFYEAVVAPLPGPVAPYFFTNAFYDFYSDMLPYLTPATVLSAQSGTVSFPLTEAVYRPADQTCTSVACHYNQSTPTSPPLRWGDTLWLPDTGCNHCH